MDIIFANEINNLCLNFFNKNLPKSGKPVLHKEWTVFSSIVEYDRQRNTKKVVALGTGTKCIGKDQLSVNGDILNDSHAEVIARRGFIRYLYQQIENTKVENKSSIFEKNSQSHKFCLRPNFEYHFFTTHSPCGDASIFENQTDDPPDAKKVRLATDNRQNTDNIGKVIINQTGAKLFESQKPDSSPLDLMAQDIGKIRTKPGRGVRTLSVSCSDKLAKWNILGLQGALLSSLLDAPIYMKSFIYCANTSCSVQSTERALYRRFLVDENVLKLLNRYPNYSQNIKIVVIKSNNGIEFDFYKNDANLSMQPCPTSISWCDVDERPLEISVGGYRQGVIKSKLKTSIGRLFITKVNLFQRFLEILKIYWEFLSMDSNSKLSIFFNSNNMDSNNSELMISYRDAKILGNEYCELWDGLKTNYFNVWTTKSDIFSNFQLSYKIN